MTTPGAEHDDKIAKCLCKLERDYECKSCRDSRYRYDPAIKDDVYIDLPEGCLGVGYIYRAAELRAQLAARGLCITPIAPTTGAGSADGMRAAAEILLTLDIEFIAAEKKAGRPTHDEAGRPASISDARSAIDTAYARILASIPSAPFPAPAREREVEVTAHPFDRVIADLEHAIATASNDDHSEPRTRERERHVERIDAMGAALDALRSRPEIGSSQFQARVHEWMLACFGAQIAADKMERNQRFIEEALELVQANGCSRSEAHQLVDYVFGRDQGEINQEVGGVMVTLAALCSAIGEDMNAAAEKELARIWTKIEKIRAKQAAKPKHSPLPEGSPSSGVAAQRIAP